LAAGEIGWSPGDGRIDSGRLGGFDAVLHLSGESIVDRWTAEKMRRIRDSRVDSTRLLCEALARTTPPPTTLICASAVGYYGDRGAEILTEKSPAGVGFLADVCQEWEQAADAARLAGIRVIHLRLGVVLSAAGGALVQMLRPFQLGLGGVVGSGHQWMSWITIPDLLGIIDFVLSHDAIAGPVNAVSPNPVTNREFTKTLGTVLNRPTIMHVPAAILRIAMGKVADETVLASARVVPGRLSGAGFVFALPELRDALRHELGVPANHFTASRS
jgi:uncharacterized protein (TIGR01777 family)